MGVNSPALYLHYCKYHIPKHFLEAVSIGDCCRKTVLKPIGSTTSSYPNKARKRSYTPFTCSFKNKGLKEHGSSNYWLCTRKHFTSGKDPQVDVLKENGCSVVCNKTIKRRTPKHQRHQRESDRSLR